MKTINTSFNDMVASVPDYIRIEIDLSFAIAKKIDFLIRSRKMSKKEFAMAIGCRPSEVTKWLSGQQNFTLRTIARLSSFFNVPFVKVPE